MRSRLIFFSVSFLIAFFSFFLIFDELFSRGKKEQLEVANNYKDNIFIENEKNKEKATLEMTEDRKEKIKIIFAGDLMFDRYIRIVAERNGNDFILENLTEELNQKDLVVANLEGPITENSSISSGSVMGSRENFVFTFNPSIIETLEKNNIFLLNIGNNHILNFGEKGLSQTRDNLINSRISFFGDTGKYKEDISYIYDLDGYKIGFVNYNSFVSGSFSRALEEIKLIRDDCDFLVVYTHWDREYQVEPLNATRQKAHQFIDLGSDLIIGTHPHIIGERESYKQKWIYYSLGNFVFDQYFRHDTTEGLLVELVINPLTFEIEINEKIVKMKTNGQTIFKN
jgi:poly-gamma-glutamate capsule biosynthesis protein CapA/YwtB (metallophosphatase superfamily)